jgi:stage II sporulation protein D
MSLRSRHVAAITALLLLGLPAVSSAATPTCFGEAATIVGTGGADMLEGTSGRDVIVGRGGADVIDGKGGDDLLCGNGGRDVIRGGNGSDRIAGGGGADEISGDAGDDRLYEVTVKDTITDAGSSQASGDILLYERLTLQPKRSLTTWLNPHADWQVPIQGHEGLLIIEPRSDGLLLVERIDPERYLLGLAEIPASWHTQALRAQAVAARTYLANLVANPRWGVMATYGFDICDGPGCQVYKGTARGAGTAWEEAVGATSGQILLAGGTPAAALYHSTSGATTRSIQDVWTSSSPISYLQAVDVPAQDSPYASWSYKLPLADFLHVLEHDGITFRGRVTSIETEVTDHGDGPYLVTVTTRQETRTITINQVQTALNGHGLEHGYPQIPDLLVAVGQPAPSPTFSVRLKNGKVQIQGEGWGHQLGLSQYGALAMAESGASFREILEHFYTGLTPETDPGFLEGTIDVGLAWERPVIELAPQGRFVLKGSAGVVARGREGTLTITPYGTDLLALTIE